MPAVETPEELGPGPAAGTGPGSPKAPPQQGGWGGHRAPPRAPGGLGFRCLEPPGAGSPSRGAARCRALLPAFSVSFPASGSLQSVFFSPKLPSKLIILLITRSPAPFHSPASRLGSLLLPLSFPPPGSQPEGNPAAARGGSGGGGGCEPRSGCRSPGVPGEDLRG